MSKKILVPIANGTEECEAIIIIDLLRRAGAEVVIASINGDFITTAHGIKISPDKALKEFQITDKFDAIVLPGGGGGVENFLNCEHLLELLKHNHSAGNIIAAICAAPLVLKHAGILSGGDKFTCYPSVADDMKLPGYTKENVVINSSGRVVTGAGPGTTFDFALKLIEILFSHKTSKEIAEAIIYKY